MQNSPSVSRRSRGLSKSEATLIAAVADWHAQHPGASVGPPMAALAEACGFSRQAAHKAVAKLDASGYLKRRSVRALNNSILLTKKGRKAIEA